MEAVMQVAREHNLFVIEDNAQAIGADYTFSDGTKKKSGTIGNVGTTSFFPSKNLGCYGDGGAIFTNDDDLAHTIRGIVNHGMYKRYYHDVVGVNSRLDSLQAAVLQIKLPLLDGFCDARRKAAMYYTEALSTNSNIITPAISVFSTHVFHQYTLRITNGKRDDLHQHLLDNNIPNAIYYPVPLHAQKAYKNERYNESDFTITNQLIDEVISLPMHTELDEDQLAFITKTINDFIG
jgi:dTDP-4-amino-4,6-dideoxygalactose transaminase